MVMERYRPRSLRTWNPGEEIERMLEDPFFSDWPFFRMLWRRAPGQEMAWAPAIEMYEKDDQFVVKADLPGVKKEDVEISLTGDTLTIKGGRKASKEVKNEDYYRCESHYGSFSRSVSLPSAADTSQVDAVFENGVLEVRMPKAKEAVATKVEIKTREQAAGQASPK